MVKKVLLGMMAFATLFATSCTNELEPIESGNTATVSFKVETPAIESRAFSDGTTATVLQYAVYNEEGELLDEFTKSVENDNAETIDNGSTTVEFNLATGDTYSVIFWAAAPVEADQTAPYTVDFAKKTMTVNYTNAVSNDENRDAFYSYKTFTVYGDQTVKVQMKRPFAQLNIGTADFEKSKTADFVPTMSSVKVSNVYTTLNFVDGSVSNPDDKDNPITFASNVIPTTFDEKTQSFIGESFPVDGYDYLAMNYLLIGSDKEIIDIEFSYTNGARTKKRTVGSVPVQRNYRTNIFGNLLTSEVDADVEINPDYDEPDNNSQVGVKIGNVLYSSFAKAYEAAQDGDELVVVGNFVLAEMFVIEKNITINLNGNEITTAYNEQTKKHEYAFDNKAELVIKNGTIKSRGIYNYGTLTLEEGGVIDACDGNGGYAIYNYGTFIMNDGSEVKTSYEDDNLVDKGGYDATTICAMSGSTTTINGGVVNNISDYTFALDIKSGATVTVNGGKLTSIHSTVSNYGDLTINGGEFICNGIEGITAHVLVAWDGSTTTINEGAFDGKDNYNGFNVDAVAGATVYIKGGEFKSVHSGSLYGDGTIVVSGGIFFDKIAEAKLAEGCTIEQLQDGNWKVEGKGWYVDANGNYHIEGAKGWLWMADQNDTFFGSKTVYLDNDIDFSGVDMRVTRMFTPEYSATFDGQNHTISNVWMASNYDQNNQALFDGLMNVKNLNVDGASVFGMSAVGIIGANLFGNIENCHVKNSRSYGYVWQIGGIVGLHSWGEIKNCSVEKTSIECYYYGAVGAIAGCMNEMSRKITGCRVKDCNLIKESSEYPEYDPLFGVVVGDIKASGNFVFDCEIENTTIKGVDSEQVYGGDLPTGSTVTINGVQQ